MVVDKDVLEGTETSRRPAVFEPGLARSLNLPEHAPGWDLGPERRIDDGRTLVRVLTGVAVAVVAVVAIVSLTRRARSS